MDSSLGIAVGHRYPGCRANARVSLNFPEDQLHGQLDSYFSSANFNLLVFCNNKVIVLISKNSKKAPEGLLMFSKMIHF